MKKAALVLALFAAAIAALSNIARANANLVVTSTYSGSAAVSAFSTPGASIMLSFSLPSMLPGTLQETGVPVTVSFDGSTTTVTSILNLFSASNGGLFNLDFTYAGDVFGFDFAGPQLFNAADNLLFGNFAIAPLSHSYPSLLEVNGVTSGLITGGTVQISSGVVSTTPEPASGSLLLIGTGLLGLGMVIRRWQARPAKRRSFFVAWLAQRRRAKYS